MNRREGLAHVLGVVAVSAMGVEVSVKHLIDVLPPDHPAASALAKAKLELDRAELLLESALKRMQ